MTPEQFCYWLQGFVELTSHHITEAQWKSIKEHLETVFEKTTPPGPGQLPPRVKLSKKQVDDIIKEMNKPKVQRITCTMPGRIC